MRDYSEVLIELNGQIKKMHVCSLKEDWKGASKEATQAHTLTNELAVIFRTLKGKKNGN